MKCAMQRGGANRSMSTSASPQALVSAQSASPVQPVFGGSSGLKWL
jgi:hypothetical protein